MIISNTITIFVIMVIIIGKYNAINNNCNNKYNI